jgi:uncharacterized protein involved in exopolysaccharide biosynthesis
MTPEQDLPSDEIDLRELIRPLLQYKWWILGFAILMAVGAFAYAKFVLPKEYTATAYVVITKPALTANLDSRIQSTFQSPDPKSLTDLTMTDDILAKVFQNLQGLATSDLVFSQEGLKSKLTPSMVGANQLRLEVVNQLPEQVAQIANLWAAAVADRLNSLFATDPEAIHHVEGQAEQARQNWAESEQILLDFLPSSHVEALTVGLNRAQKSLDTYLLEIVTLDLVLADALVLKARLDSLNGNEILATDDALSLIAIQQRAIGNIENFQIQVTGADVLGDNYTVAEARDGLDTLIASLQNQRDDFQAKVDELENTITELTTQLENAKFQLTQLTVQRDINLKAYQALSSRIEEMQITLSQADQAAKVAGQALPPQQPSGPRVLLYTAAAGIIGFGLAALVVLVWSWWKSPAPASQSKPESDK